MGALVLVGIAGVSFTSWQSVGRFQQSTDDAFLQADQVIVSAQVAGHVDAVLVTDNEAVAAGQTLARIDTRTAAAKLTQAQAEVQQATAVLAQTKAQIAQQEAQVGQIQAQEVGAQAAAAFADRQVDRYSPLAASGADTQERLDNLKRARDEARAQADAAAAQLLAARRQVQTIRAQLPVAGAQAAQARAHVAQASVDVDDAVEKASIAGRIGDRSVRVGQYVQPGDHLMTLVPTQSLYLLANFKETQLARMRVGQPAKVNVDALGGVALNGVVDSFAPGTGSQFALIAPNNATGNFTKIVQRVPVRIRLDLREMGQAVLVPGMSARVSVDTRDLHPQAPVAGE